MNPAEAVYKTANKEKNLPYKVSLDEVIKIAVVFRKKMPDPKNIFGTGITLTNYKIKDIIKLVKSLENRGVLLKGTNKKITTILDKIFGKKME